jgi:hypothetical protein
MRVPLVSSRVVALVSASVFDAVNATARELVPPVITVCSLCRSTPAPGLAPQLLMAGDWL